MTYDQLLTLYGRSAQHMPVRPLATDPLVGASFTRNGMTTRVICRGAGRRYEPVVFITADNEAGHQVWPLDSFFLNWQEVT